MANACPIHTHLQILVISIHLLRTITNKTLIGKLKIILMVDKNNPHSHNAI